MVIGTVKLGQSTWVASHALGTLWGTLFGVTGRTEEISLSQGVWAATITMMLVRS